MRITSALGICIFVLLPISQAYASDFAPSAPGASVLTSQSQSVKVDDASGALRQRVALNIPPGRNGLQPDIALEYNSQNTDVDSIVGYGWSLSIPYIARLNKTGSQNLYDPTNAFFTSSMDGELTTGSTTSPYAYRARVDTGAFLPYTYSTSTNSWIVYDKTGTRYLFGTTTQAQQSATTSPSNVYKWMLEEVRDTNDNFVRYTYLKDGNQIYPYQIFYTGSGASDGPGTITFATSTRPDTYTSYKTGFKVWTNYRISEITAAFNGSNVRRFTLSYTTGHNGYRSLLSSIQETGWDEDANATTLPPMTFSYASSTSAFIAQSGSPTVNGQGWIITDLNGDGLNDKATLYVQNGAKYGSIYHGGTASQGDVVVPETLAIFAGGQTIEYPARERGVRILDINADGKADIVRGEWNYTTQTATTSLYLNAYSTSTGYSFPTTTTSQVDIPRFSEDGTGTIHGLTSGIFADLNGTGLPSFVQRVDGHFNIATYLADGLGWSPATTTLFSAPQSFPISATSTATSSQMVDLNADGLADWVYSDTTSTYALLNTGRGWEESPDTAWTIATTTLFFAPGGGPTAYYDRGIRFADINGDGLPDFLHLYTLDNTITSASVPQPDAGTYNDVLLNTGHGWATTTAYGTLGKITTARAPAGVWSGSFEYNEYGNWNGNGQQNQDVLQTILYPKGGSTTVTYGYTAQSGTNPELPYSLLVVTSVINRDSRGGSEETIYAYAGGKQYVADGVFDRKFAGFSTITKTRANSITTTYYHQADSANTGAGEQNDSVDRIGQPFREDIADSSGTIVERTFFRWDADTSVSTTTTSSTTTFPTSPVSYWKVDEASGTAFDSVIANHLTNNNTATYSSGRINNGVNLVRASSQYLSITNASQIGLGVSGDFTVAGWVKFSTIPTSGIAYALASKRNNQSTYTNPGFFSYLYHTGSALKLYGGFDEDDSPGNGETAGMASWSPSTDTWYHVAMVVDADASTITFYVDASPLSTSYDTTNATSVGSNTKPFNLGADNPGGTPQHFMNGSMDEWGFWDRALTSNEVSELYNNGSGLSYGASVRTSTTTLLHLGAKMVQSFDGTTHTDKATTYQYATSTQNLIRTNDYGQVSGNSDGTFTDTGSDSRTTTVSYAASSTVNLVVPREKTLFSNSSETTTNVRFYYDNLSLGSVNIGNQTKEESWITGSGYASTTKTYNAYGLVATSTDARGNATSYAYDTFNLYPATTTNALIQQTGFQYN